MTNTVLKQQIERLIYDSTECQGVKSPTRGVSNFVAVFAEWLSDTSLQERHEAEKLEAEDDDDFEVLRERCQVRDDLVSALESWLADQPQYILDTF